MQYHFQNLANQNPLFLLQQARFLIYLVNQKRLFRPMQILLAYPKPQILPQVRQKLFPRQFFLKLHRFYPHHQKMALKRLYQNQAVQKRCHQMQFPKQVRQLANQNFLRLQIFLLFLQLQLLQKILFPLLPSKVRHRQLLRQLQLLLLMQKRQCRQMMFQDVLPEFWKQELHWHCLLLQFPGQ